jgi:GTPase SAR1 family protein
LTRTRRDQIENEPSAFQIWDTAGAEQFRALTPLDARDARGAAVVFGLTRRTASTIRRTESCSCASRARSPSS